ncbi:hypothetical protein BHM03_00047724 [Ensete ventricosum]|nr:hypothetical protein BHM03_00047724 [Ensete ventricosum]
MWTQAYFKCFYMTYTEKDGKVKFRCLLSAAKIVPWPIRGAQQIFFYLDRSSSLWMVCGKSIHCALSCTTMVMRTTSLSSNDGTQPPKSREMLGQSVLWVGILAQRVIWS